MAFRFLRTATGQDINGVGASSASIVQDYSESFSPANHDEVGIVVSLGATSSGTTPTLAAALQFSPDGGTHWGAVPQADASSTAATTGALAKGTSISLEAVRYWKLPVVESNSVASNPLYRFAFAFADPDNAFTKVSYWLALRKRGGQRNP